MVTTQTPDIVDPYDGTDSVDERGIFANGRVKFEDENARGTAFWPRTTKRLGSEVKFDLLVDGNIPTRMPLIFVDNAAANNKTAVELICKHYNKLGSSTASSFVPDLTEARFGGAKLTYAPESQAGDTQFETQSVVFGAEGWRAKGEKPIATKYFPFPTKGPDGKELGAKLAGAPTNSNFFSDPFMQGADQPPFYPAMRYARIKVGQIERLVGHPMPPNQVAYDPSYALHGFPDEGDGRASGANDGGAASDAGYDPKANPKEIFLSLIDPPRLTFGQGGDKGGAVA